jgi:hypothetical protein
MSKKILQYILGFLGVLFTVRFFLPGVILGGGYVTEADLVTAYLDSEVRFLSAISGGYAALYFYMIKGVEKKLGIILIMAITALIGGTARMVSVLQYGLPALDRQIAIALEFIIPVVVLVLRNKVAKDYA